MSDPSVIVVDREGRDQALSPEEATRAYRSGQYGVPGERVAVRHPDGSVGTVAAGELHSFLSHRDARLASQEELAQERFRMEHQGAGADLAAAGIGAAHGLLPFGIGQDLVTAFSGGDVNSEQQRRYRHESPTLSGAAEIGGAVLPMLLSGGASGAARGAAAAAEGAELASGAARGVAGAAEAANAVRGAELATEAAQAARGASAVAPEVSVAADVAGGASDAALAAREATPTAVLANPRAVGQTAIEQARTLPDVPGPVRLGGYSADTQAITRPMDAAVEAAVASNPQAAAAVDAFDAAQALRTPSVAAETEVASGMYGAVRPGMARIEMPAVDAAAVEAAQSAARTATLEAGVPVLGREALAASEAIATGNRPAFMRALAGAIDPIGTAGNALRGALPGTAGRVGATALEGSLYGASNYVNQSMLEDEPLSAEGLVMAMTGGALLGAAGEGVVGGLASLGRRGSESVASRLSPTLRDAMSEGRLSQYLADELAVRAVRPTAGQRQQLAQRMLRDEAGNLVRGGERNVQEVGAILNESGALNGAPSLVEINARLNEMAPKAGRELGTIMQRATESGELAAVSNTQRVLTEIRNELRTSKLASDRAMEKRIMREFGDINATMRPSEMHSLRMRMDDRVNWDKTAEATPMERVYRRMRNAVREDIDATMSSIAQKHASNPELANLNTQWLQANRKYRALSWAQNASAKAVARAETSANVPLTSLLSGAGAGLVFGGVSPKALAVGFVTGAFHRWFKEHAAAIGASGLSAHLKGEALNRTARAINTNAVRSVRAAFRATPSVVRRAALYGATLSQAKRMTSRQYQRTATDLYRLSVDPEATLAAGEALAPVIQSAPSVGTAAQQVQAARLAYLHSLLPRAQSPDQASQLLAIRSATPKQRTQFAEALAIASNPDAFMGAFAEADITSQQVAHMRALWPATYQTMVNAAAEEMARPEPVAPQALRAVRILLGQPSFAETAQYVSILQTNYATPGPGTPGTAPPTTPQAVESSGVAERTLTSQQATEQRIAAGGPGS